MRERIDEPMAEAVVTWRGAAEGGRRSGPPTAPVYAATAVFPQGEDEELRPGRPGRPATAEQVSVLLEKTDREREDGSPVYLVDFPVRELAAPHLRAGAQMLVMEGPKVVASARVTEVR